MTFTNQGNVVSTTVKSSGTTLAATPSSILAVGDLLIAIMASDNLQLTDGDITSVSFNDDQGNTWTRLFETNRTGGSANDGVTCAAFYCLVTTQIGTGDNITMTTPTVTNRQFTVEHWTMTGTGITPAGVATVRGNGVSPTVTSGTISSAEYLWIGALGVEGKDGDTFVQDTDYSNLAQTGNTTGGPTSNTAVRGGYRVYTGTVDTYNTGPNTGRDYATGIVALEETGGAEDYFQDVDGVLTPAGDIIKKSGKILVGISTFTGSISKATTKTFTGSITAVGTIINKVSKIFTGSLTSSGILSTTKVTLLAIGGAMTASGKLIKSTAKLFAGSVTATGTLVNQTIKALVGSITASGILSTTKVTLLAISGSITASGILAKQTLKAFIGATTATGSLIRSTVKAFTGSFTASGILSTTKVTLLSISGSITASGILIKHTAKTFIGSVAAAGSLATQKITIGGEQFYKAIGGVLAMTGSITRRFGRNVNGVLTAVGVVFRHSIGLPTPARRIYSIASENRIYAIQR